MTQKDRIINKLCTLWNLHTDEESFGRMLTNLILVGNKYANISTLIHSYVFRMTDDELEEWLDKSLVEDK